jgi:hypothetical protein
MSQRILTLLVGFAALSACAGPGPVPTVPALPDQGLANKVDAQGRQLAEIQAAVRAVASSSRTARFQVTNGTPEMSRNIILVDTQTGKTWLLCGTKDQESIVNTGWCAMNFYGSGSAPTP